VSEESSDHWNKSMDRDFEHLFQKCVFVDFFVQIKEFGLMHVWKITGYWSNNHAKSFDCLCIAQHRAVI
jgi:hypothetical protein